MTFRLFILILVVLSSCSQKATDIRMSSFEKNTIDYSKDEKHSLNESFADFLTHFEVCVSKQVLFNTRIILTDNPKYVTKKISDQIEGSRQSFYLEASENQLLIYADYSDGIRNGLYWYLDKLGMKWYFPGEHWKIYPNKHVNLLKFNDVVVPSLANRSFFGGGGFPSNFPGDPENKVETEWKIWMDRNLWGNETKSIGHAWQQFVRRNKEELLKYPQYLAVPLNKTKPKYSTKLCVGNPGLVKLFIKDRRALLEEVIKKFGKDHINAQRIGVEPSDGKGFCECEKCKKIGSLSDQVFYLANKVAENLEKDFPHVKISLLAYNQHTAVPNIELHKNLFITVVPWRFQHETFADNIVEEWRAKHQNIEIYYYWSLLITSKGKPLKQLMKIAQKEIDFLKENKVNGFRVETTYSIGAVGIPLYVMSRLAFDSSMNQDQLLNELFIDCFGKANTIMMGMLNRWSEIGFVPRLEKYLIVDEFDKAKKLAETEAEKTRIEEFKKYVSFLFYVDDVETNKKNPMKLDISLDNLINYSYSILPSLMVHSYWLSSPFMRFYNMDRYIREGRTRERKRPSSYWSNLKTNPHPNTYTEKSKKYQMIQKAMNNNIVINRSANKNDLPKRANDGRQKVLKINSLRGFGFTINVSSKKTIELDFEAKVITASRFGTMVGLGVYNELGEQIDVQIFKGGGNRKTKIALPVEGIYRIKWKLTNVKFALNWYAPENVILDCGTPISTGRYFYETDMKNDLLVNARSFKVYSSTGKSLVKEKIEESLFLIDVSQVDDGKLYFESDRIIQILNSDNCKFFIDTSSKN